jgi:acyl dehydratase
MTRIRPGWSGRFYEDFAAVDVYRCRYGWTITQFDNISFSLLTSNSNQLHFNDDCARRTEWGRCLVNSLLTHAAVTGLSTADVSENGFALGWGSIELPHPVFAGDTSCSESEVLDKRESKSRSGQGVVEIETRGCNQDGVLVTRFRRAVMVSKKEHAPIAGLFPAHGQTEPEGIAQRGGGAAGDREEWRR